MVVKATRVDEAVREGTKGEKSSGRGRPTEQLGRMTASWRLRSGRAGVDYLRHLVGIIPNHLGEEGKAEVPDSHHMPKLILCGLKHT